MYICVYIICIIRMFSIEYRCIYMCVHFVHYLLPTTRSSNSNASYEVGGALPISKDSSMSMEEKGSSFSEEDDKTAAAGPRWMGCVDG